MKIISGRRKINARTTFALAAGLIIGIVISQLPFIQFERTVNVLRLISVIIMAVLTFLVGFYGRKRYGDRRAEKDLIIDQAKEVIRHARRTERTFLKAFARNEDVDSNLILAQLDDLGYSIEDLRRMLQYGQYSSLETELDEINSTFVEYRKVLSGGNFPKLSHSGSFFGKAQRLNSEIINLAYKTAFEVNTN